MPVTKLRTLAVAGAAAATLAVGILPAYAVATWTVTAGTAAAGHAVAIKGTTTGPAPQITFVDTTTNTTLTCASGTAPGSTTTGSGRSGTAIGTINGPGTTWTGCTGPLGIALNPKGVGTWNINARTYNAGTGTTTGTITGANARVTGNGCAFTVKGSVPITYKNSTRILTVKPTAANLAVSNVSGCFGAVNPGDKASFSGKYLLKANIATFNPIHITSP